MSGQLPTVVVVIVLTRYSADTHITHRHRCVIATHKSAGDCFPIATFPNQLLPSLYGRNPAAKSTEYALSLTANGLLPHALSADEPILSRSCSSPTCSCYAVQETLTTGITNVPFECYNMLRASKTIVQ